MLSTEEATALIAKLGALAFKALTTHEDEDALKYSHAFEHMVALLTGSSRIDRPAVDPNTETQLVEAVRSESSGERIPKPGEAGDASGTYAEDAYRREGSDAAKQEMLCAKLVLLDELILRNRRLHTTLLHYVGCEPGKLLLRSRDLLFMVVDVGLLMKVAGGPWLDVINQIESDEADRKVQTKFAARSTENLAPEILKAQKTAAAATEGQPDGSNG